MHRVSGGTESEQKQTVCDCTAHTHTADADRYNFATVSKTNWRENTFTSSAMTREQKPLVLRLRDARASAELLRGCERDNTFVKKFIPLKIAWSESCRLK